MKVHRIMTLSNLFMLTVRGDNFLIVFSYGAFLIFLVDIRVAAESLSEVSTHDNDPSMSPAGENKPTSENYDANSQLAYAIERIGPMVLAMKNKFDEYCGDKVELNEQNSIGKPLDMLVNHTVDSNASMCGLSAFLMDLGLKGPHLAACLAELESSLLDSTSTGIEFSAIVILYSRHSGLRVPSSYRPGDKKDRDKASICVPTTTGLWDEVNSIFL